jgi:ferrous iron transport protein B
MVLPFMSCGARLPIYALIIPAFFAKQYQAFTMWMIYITGVLTALIAARIMKSTLFKGDGEVYLMELPPYRMPSLKSLLLHMWDRGRMYLQKAGTIILLTSVILYICNTYPEKKEFSVDYEARISEMQKKGKDVSQLKNAQLAEKLEYTISGRVGKALEPLFAPVGFDWKITTAAIGALAAKEVFVAQMGILYAEGVADEESEGLRAQLVKHYTPLQAFCIMIFCLLSIPCLATLAIIKRELNSWKMAFVEAGALFALAYTATLIVYQLGTAFEVGTQMVR